MRVRSIRRAIEYLHDDDVVACILWTPENSMEEARVLERIMYPGDTTRFLETMQETLDSILGDNDDTITGVILEHSIGEEEEYRDRRRAEEFRLSQQPINPTFDPWSCK